MTHEIEMERFRMHHYCVNGLSVKFCDLKNSDFKYQNNIENWTYHVVDGTLYGQQNVDGFPTGSLFFYIVMEVLMI